MPISITPSGINTAGEQYQLTCKFLGSITPIFVWTGPPNDRTLPSDSSDTRMVSDVMSSGSTHTSILQFDPLQSSHGGNYLCRVTVGTVTKMRSFQVNVDTPVPMTTQRPTTQTEGSNSTEGTGGDGGVSIGAVAGGTIVVLLVVAVAILLAVILLLYWRHRYVRTLASCFQATINTDLHEISVNW